MLKLQVLQNKALRIYKKVPRETPIRTLLAQSNSLSVHQLVAYHSAVQVYKVNTTKKPEYHYHRLFGENRVLLPRTRSDTNNDSRVDFKLSLARTSFFFQSSRIWSAIPLCIKTAKSLETFKRAMKIWIKTNIKMKP